MSHYKGGGEGPKHGLTKYSDLPNMLAVPLKAGQTIFWEGDLIHRGSMRPGVERCTLHCSMGAAGKPAPDRKPTACDKRTIWQTHGRAQSIAAGVAEEGMGRLAGGAARG